MHNRLDTLVRSKTLLAALVAAVVLAVAGSTYGYAALSSSVTLSVDGQEKEVTALGDTVGDVLESEGIDVGDHDDVAPGLDEQVTDGSRIAVAYGRPLELSVDGETQTHWVTSTDGRRGAHRARPGLRQRRAVGQPWLRHLPRRALPRGRHPEDRQDQGRPARRSRRRGSPRSPSATSSTSSA